MAIGPKQITEPTQEELEYCTELEKKIDTILASKEGSIYQDTEDVSTYEVDVPIFGSAIGVDEGICNVRPIMVRHIIMQRYRAVGWSIMYIGEREKYLKFSTKFSI